MKKYISSLVVLVFIISSMTSKALAARQNFAQLGISPTDRSTATVTYGNWPQGIHSTIDITLKNLPTDSGLVDGTYSGWCIQAGITGQLTNEEATLYSSLSKDLPTDLSGLPWNKINYILNHKVHGVGRSDADFHKDVQTAIWLILGDTKLDFGVSPEAQLMANEANANSNYAPGNGDLVAVIVYFDGMSRSKKDKVQETIIEVELKIPTPTPTNTATMTPTGTLPTNTPTNTATFTPTGTLPTNTPINTPTFTPTGTLPTNTPTFTPTNTPTTCVSTTVIADFSKVAVGTSVEGLGKVAPSLNIDAKGTAIKVAEGTTPIMYVANKSGINTANGFVAPGGGFSDADTRNAIQAHQYTFTFASGIAINNFSVRMLDFGDANPTNATNHYGSLSAYDINGALIGKHELSYTTLAETLPQSSNLYGNLQINGDASAPLGQPGNWKWNINGSGIVKLTLEFAAGFDPNIAFDGVVFTTECAQTQPTNTPTSTSTSTPPTNIPSNTPTATTTACVPATTTVDFSRVAIGASVEGMGVVAPNLNIDAKNTAVRVEENNNPIMYVANKNGINLSNAYTVSGKGFSDLITRNAAQPHLYTFTFAAGTSVNNFSVHMLDFGDINPTATANHYASLTAYDINNNPIAKHELIYITPAVLYPQSSNLYGNLQATGDASTSLGMPGNWMWKVSANGIAKVVLEFGEGHDPNISFDLIAYSSECNIGTPTPVDTPTPIPTGTPTACVPTAVKADFTKVITGASIEGFGTVAPYLNIDAKNTAVRVIENLNPTMYLANKLGINTINGFLAPGGGFSDAITRNAVQPHLYTFSLAPGVSISTFSVRMLDFGDANPSLATDHYASLSAYDTNNVLVGKHELSYTTPAQLLPTSSNLYGNLQINGDASAPLGQPGNWLWNVVANGITRLVLELGVGADPNIAFDGITFTTECP